MIDYLVLGSLNADALYLVHNFPNVGETIHSYDYMPMLGGKGGNQAAAIARLGGSVAMAGRVGNDVFGPRSIENLRNQGVDTQTIIIDEKLPTGTATGIVSDDGKNIIVVSSGANGQILKQDVDKLQPLFDQAKFLILQFEIPIDTVVYALEKANEHPIKVILNPAPAYDLPRESYKKIHCLIPNEKEAALITSIEVTDLTSAEKAGRRLADWGVRNTIITLGDNGALLVTKNKTSHFPAVSVNAIDPTACGDAFVGGFAIGLGKGYPIENAIEYANCAGAMAATRFGAQPSLPYAQEVDELYNKNYQK